jgi:RNA polymerase sigma-70 factor (ECF subfamily)
MDMTNENLSSLIARAKAGDEEAVRGLKQFEEDIRTMVRIRLPRPLRTQFDSMDFVQAVWQSFFRICKDDPERFEQVHDLRSFLVGVVRHKVFEEHRRRSMTQKYDIGREEPLYIRRGNREVPRDVVATDPTPSQDAQARERLDQIHEGLTPREIEVVDLRRLGLTFEEIAARTGLHERTVRRVIEAIRRRIDLRTDP